MKTAFSLIVAAALLGAGCAGRAANNGAPEAEIATLESKPAGVTLAVSSARIQSAVAILATQIKTPVRISSEMSEERVSVLIDNRPWEEAISTVAASAGGTWWQESDGSITIGREYPGPVQARVFELGTADVEKVVRALRPLLSRSGSVSEHPGNGAILVMERDKYMPAIAAALARVSPTAGEGRLLHQRHTYLDQPVTIALSDGRLTSAASILQNQIPQRLNLYGTAQEARVTILSERRSLGDLLDELAMAADLIWWEEGTDQIGLADRGWYVANRLPAPAPRETPATSYDPEKSRQERLRQHQQKVQDIIRQRQQEREQQQQQPQ